MTWHKANVKKVATLKEWNDLYDCWYDAENRADKFKFLFILACIFATVFLIAACGQQCDEACKAQGEQHLNEILKQRKVC